MRNDGWWALTGIAVSGTVVLLGARRLWFLLKSDHDPWAEREERRRRQGRGDQGPSGPRP